MKTSRPKPANSMLDDSRCKLIDAALRRHGRDAHALIELLHTTQEVFGYLPRELLRHISKELGVPESRVFGVATFYHFFSLEPKGRHSCIVCLGTACYVKHAADLLTAVRQEFAVEPEHITPDGELSFGVARCFGSCGQAPVVLIDGQAEGKATPASLLKRLATIMQRKSSTP